MSNVIQKKNGKKKKKKEILTAARVVFSRYGYKKTAMVDIAEEVGLNQATLYHYFDNKEQIFIEKILEDHKKFRDERLKLIADELTIQRKIISFLNLKIDFFYSNKIYEQIAELNTKRIPEKHRKKLDNLSRQEQAFVKSLLENAKQTGELPSNTDTTQLTKLIFRIFQGIRIENQFGYFLSRQKPQMEHLMKEIEESIEYLLDNLKK